MRRVRGKRISRKETRHSPPPDDCPSARPSRSRRDRCQARFPIIVASDTVNTLLYSGAHDIHRITHVVVLP